MSTQTLQNMLLETNIKTPSPLFIQILAEDSNNEMDWLWFAEQLTRDAERQYCYRRALYINPISRAAQAGLKQLAHTQQTHMRTPALPWRWFHRLVPQN
jgi:hypothetical protein